MKLLLCITLGLVTLTINETNAKNIKIQIDPDDILKLLNGVMASETVKNFATQLAQRGLSKGMGYNNPYHPEDDLVNTFNDAVNKEKHKYENKLRQKTPTKPEVDPLDIENELFVDGNEVISEDVLTENEQGTALPLKEVLEKGTPAKSLKFINIQSPKPVNKVKHINKVKLLNANDTKSAEKNLKIGKPGKVLRPFDKPILSKTTVNPGKKTYEIELPLKQVQTRKNTRQVAYKDDRANFKPVQTRFVLKSSSDGDNVPNLKEDQHKN